MNRRIFLLIASVLSLFRESRKIFAQDPAKFPTTRQAAEKVAKRLDEEYVQNPIIVLMIIQIIVSVISILQNYCQEKSKDIAKLAQEIKDRKTLVARRRWRVFKLNVINEIGIEQFRSLGGDALLEAMLDEAILDKNGKLMESLYKEVKSG